MVDGRQQASNIRWDSDSRYVSRVIFFNTLESLRKTTQEMAVKAEEVEALIEKLKATKSEVGYLLIAINDMAAKFDLEPIFVKHISQ